MAHTLIVIFLYLVIFLSPCVAASSIDLEEEESLADYRQALASSQEGIRLSSQHRKLSSS